MPTESPRPSIEVPKEDLYAFCMERKDRPFPDNHVIFIDGDSGLELTFAGIREQAEAFGRGLQSRWGWEKGDVMALFRFPGPHGFCFVA
jgi:4-coumarate--CoA ligase